jgi:hypothetical protein
MKNRKQLLFYIVLNIIISAATTLLVLWLWDRPNRYPLPDNVPPAAAYPLDNGTSYEPVGTPIPLDKEVIRITNVFGIGDVQNEMIELERVGDGDVLLTGWKLKDQDHHVFDFPANLVMYKGAKINIYSRIGNPSVIEQFWGSSEAIWQPGETATLLDAQGNVRAKYTIP